MQALFTRERIGCCVRTSKNIKQNRAACGSAAVSIGKDRSGAERSDAYSTERQAKEMRFYQRAVR